MAHFMAQRTNSKSNVIHVYTMRGDRRSAKPKYTIKLDKGDTIEQKLDDLGLKMVGRWIELEVMGAKPSKSEVVDVFPK